jgi:hypothetical protein
MPEEHADMALQAALWWCEGAASAEVEAHTEGDVAAGSSCLAAGKLFLAGVTPPLATTVFKNRKAMEGAAAKNAEGRLRQAAAICGLPLGEGVATSAMAVGAEAAEAAELLAGLLQRSALVDMFKRHDSSAGEFLAPKLLPLPPSADAVLLSDELRATLFDERRQLSPPGSFLANCSSEQKDRMAEAHALLAAAAEGGSAAAAFGLSIVFGEVLSPQANALMVESGSQAVAQRQQHFAMVAGMNQAV